MEFSKQKWESIILLHIGIFSYNNVFLKITIFQKQTTLPKFHQISKIWQRWQYFEKFLFFPSNSSLGSKTKWKRCPICLISTKLTYSSPMSADVSWFLMDFKNTFWHEKMPMYSHIQDSYFYFENFITYLDFKKD